MFKRIALVLTFLAAFSLVGSALAPQAQAWRGGWGRPYGAYYARHVPTTRTTAAIVTQHHVPTTTVDRAYRSYYAPHRYYYGPAPGVAVTYGY